jgi:type IV pilus assembly protein PilA
MLCAQCGTEIPNQSKFCFNCGSSLEKIAGLSGPPREPERATQLPPATGRSATQEAGARKRSSWPSVVGWALIVIAVLGGWQRLSTEPSVLVTVIFMIALGIGLIRRWSGKRIGIILASIFLADMFVVIALQKSTRTRMISYEMGAIQSIRTIQTAQNQYYSKYGRYAAALSALGPPTTGVAGPEAADLIDSVLARGEKGGYNFTLNGNAGWYVINANPVTFGVNSTRSFYSNETMVLRQNFGGAPATAKSQEVK